MPSVPPRDAPDADRLRALTEAVIAVGAGLELDDVLQRLVSTAAGLSGAQYGALGITGDDGRIVRLISHGIDPALRERLGGLPTAHGLPGLLLETDAHAVRLSDIGRHPRSVGFPNGHPPMRTFLGVPVKVSGRIFGNLYVAEKQPSSPDSRPVGDGPALFTAEDEEALLALGAAAGVAVENARLYAAARHRQRWSAALGEAIQTVVEHSALDTRQRLTRIPAIVRRAAGADAAVVTALEPGGWHLLSVDRRGPAGPEVAGGEAAPGLGPGESPEPGVVLLPPTWGAPVLDAVTTIGPGELGWLPGDWAYGLVIPVCGPTAPLETAVVLAFAQLPPSALRQDERDSELAFGQRLGLALQVAQAQADSAALRLLRDRDRIARDLHDLVIQRLFAIGLSLQAAGVVARVPEVRGRLDRAVDEIDETIKDVRRSIFELHDTAVRSAVRDRLEAVVDDARPGLPDDLSVHLDGLLDTVPDGIAADLVAVLREALSNVSRHAGASAVRIYVTVGADLELEVEDDGVGVPGDVPRGDGLPNLAARAASHGGGLRLSAAREGGTVLRWAVPLPPTGREGSG